MTSSTTPQKTSRRRYTLVHESFKEVRVPDSTAPLVRVSVPRALIDIAQLEPKHQAKMVGLAVYLNQGEKMYDAHWVLDRTAAPPYNLSRIPFRQWLKHEGICEFSRGGGVFVMGLNPAAKLEEILIPTSGHTVAEVAEIIFAQVYGIKSELWNKLNPAAGEDEVPNRWKAVAKVHHRVKHPGLPIDEYKARAHRRGPGYKSKALEILSGGGKGSMSALNHALRRAPAAPRMQNEDFSRAASEKGLIYVRDGKALAPDATIEDTVLTACGLLTALSARCGQMSPRMDVYGLPFVADFVREVEALSRGDRVAANIGETQIAARAKQNPRQFVIDLVLGCFTNGIPYGSVCDLSAVFGLDPNALVMKRGLQAFMREGEGVSHPHKRERFKVDRICEVYNHLQRYIGVPETPYPGLATGAARPVAALPPVSPMVTAPLPQAAPVEGEYARLLAVGIDSIVQDLTPADDSSESYMTVVNTVAMGDLKNCAGRLKNFILEARKHQEPGMKTVDDFIQEKLSAVHRDFRKLAFFSLRKQGHFPGDPEWRL